LKCLHAHSVGNCRFENVKFGPKTSIGRIFLSPYFTWGAPDFRLPPSTIPVAVAPGGESGCGFKKAWVSQVEIIITVLAKAGQCPSYTQIKSRSGPKPSNANEKQPGH